MEAEVAHGSLIVLVVQQKISNLSCCFVLLSLRLLHVMLEMHIFCAMLECRQK